MDFRNAQPVKNRHSVASAVYFSPGKFSAHDCLTSEQLRTLSMMAASKPTSWLSATTQPFALSKHLGALADGLGCFPLGSGA